MNKIKCIEFSPYRGPLNIKYYQDFKERHKDILTYDFKLTINPVLELEQVIIVYENGEKDIRVL